VSVVVGLDIGTSGARALAVDESGKVLADASAEYPILSPRPGWSEQDPEQWWRGATVAIRKVAGAAGGRVVGIGLAGQMHGSVFLDPRDRVIRPALLWNDQRTDRQCRQITETLGRDHLVAITGNPALTGFQAPKILWLRDEEPEHFKQVAHVLLPKDYIRLRLSHDYATDASDASGTLLLDLRRRTWSEEILKALDLPGQWFPPVFESPVSAGALDHNVAVELGLPPGIPIAAGGGDNAAAAVGIGIVEEGLISSSIGSSGVLFANTATFEPEPSGRLHAFCSAVPGGYHLLGVTLAAGASLRWWRSVMENQDGYDSLSELAATVPPGAEGLIFLPYLTGERTPHLDPEARGAFFGLTARHSRAHLTRALMEGVVFSLADSLAIMVGLGLSVRQIRVIGGGARSALWRQIQADVFGMPVYRTVVDEGPAYGAALLAGVSAGLFANVDEACSVIRLRPDVTEPDERRTQLYKEYLSIYQSLYPLTKAAMSGLSRLAVRGPLLETLEDRNRPG
jgi:xylulokinase